jgi:hypothetical protein
MISLRHTTLGMTPLYEGSARRRDLYLTTHNTHKRQTSMHLAEFEPTIPKSERPQTDAATGIGERRLYSPFLPAWNGQEELYVHLFTKECLIFLSAFQPLIKNMP